MMDSELNRLINRIGLGCFLGKILIRIPFWNKQSSSWKSAVNETCASCGTLSLDSLVQSTTQQQYLFTHARGQLLLPDLTAHARQGTHSSTWMAARVICDSNVVNLTLTLACFHVNGDSWSRNEEYSNINKQVIYSGGIGGHVTVNIE